MAEKITIAIHRSQFPSAARHALMTSMHTRQIHPKLHYEGLMQTLRWLALHEAVSPVRQKPDCREVYEGAFDFLVKAAPAKSMQVVGLGCGGGWKEAELLRALQASGRPCVYFPVDVSVPMVIVAVQTALAAVAECECHPLVADLSEVEDLAGLLNEGQPDAPRIITCFGLLPNFEPPVIGRRLGSLVRAGDWLALSANLAPGSDYQRGAEAVLPQYDNPPTREWLTGLLRNLGFEDGDGQLCFKLETAPGALNLLRIVADFVLERPKKVEVDARAFAFSAGDCFRVFFSYRYTAERVRALLAAYGLTLLESWLSQEGEEGVFVCCRDGDTLGDGSGSGGISP